MKRLVGVLVIVALTAQYASAVSLRKRREANATGEDTGVVDSMMGIVGMAESIPLVGGYITFARHWVGDTASAVADLDNGIIARILGGTLPCEIDIDKGITCTGVTDRTNVAHLILALLDQSPLPNIGKSIIRSILSNTLDPILNIIFGGVALQSA